MLLGILVQICTLAPDAEHLEWLQVHLLAVQLDELLQLVGIEIGEVAAPLQNTQDHVVILGQVRVEPLLDAVLDELELTLQRVEIFARERLDGDYHLRDPVHGAHHVVDQVELPEPLVLAVGLDAARLLVRALREQPEE